MSDPEVERRFEVEMQGIYDQARAIGYPANRFLVMLREHGGVETAHGLLRGAHVSDGFTELSALGRLDLTVESLVLRPEFRGLFSEVELETATRRLEP